MQRPPPKPYLRAQVRSSERFFALRIAPVLYRPGWQATQEFLRGWWQHYGQIDSWKPLNLGLFSGTLTLSLPAIADEQGKARHLAQTAETLREQSRTSEVFAKELEELLHQSLAANAALGSENAALKRNESETPGLCSVCKETRADLVFFPCT